jgi:preprotein translocase subunit SecG
LAPLTLTLAQLPLWATSVLVVFYVLISVVMILAVLIQRPQGGGLSTAFGAGAGSGQTAFGTKIGDALTIFTITVFILFLASSIALVYFLRPADPGNVQPTITSPEGAATLPTGEGDQPSGTTGAAPAQPTGDTPADTTGQPPAETPTDQPAPTGNIPPAENPATDPGNDPGAPSTEPVPEPAGEPTTPPANPGR